MYSDASNFKKYGQFIVYGNVVQSDIECYLFEGEFFIPEYVGVPSLAPFVFSEQQMVGDASYSIIFSSTIREIHEIRI